VAEEVWHYRYVGKEAAAEIHERGTCLEEYLESPER
jgi:D-alanyl-D-alanine carboxypeptidase